MKTQFKAVLFDLDGTLADTQKDLADAMNRVLSKNLYPTHSDEDYKYLVGKGLKMLVNNALPESERNENTINTLLNEMVVDYSQNCLNQTKLYQGIPELLKALNELNLPLVVFSNKEHDLTLKVCDSLLKDFQFAAFLGRSDERPRKPNPAGALFLAEQLNLPPQDILYIGDTDNDMICAKRAGMKSVGVLWGFREKEELINTGASFIAENPMEILEIVTSL